VHLIGFITGILYEILVLCTYLLYFITTANGSRLYIISDFRYPYSKQVSLAQSNAPSVFLNKPASRHLNFSLQAFMRMSALETGIMLQVNRLN
jgi:hypothetical protein